MARSSSSRPEPRLEHDAQLRPSFRLPARDSRPCGFRCRRPSTSSLIPRDRRPRPASPSRYSHPSRSSGVPGGRRNSTLNSPWESWGMSSTPSFGMTATAAAKSAKAIAMTRALCASAQTMSLPVPLFDAAVGPLEPPESGIERLSKPAADERIDSAPEPRQENGDRREHERARSPRESPRAPRAGRRRRSRRDIRSGRRRAKRGEHRDEGEGDGERGEEREGDRERLIPEELPRDPLDEDERQEDGDGRERRGDDGARDLAGAVAHGAHRVLSLRPGAGRCSRGRRSSCRRASRFRARCRRAT